MKRKIIITIIIFHLILFFVISTMDCLNTSSSTCYYVSTSGNDINNGLTIDTAWATPSYAAKKAKAGDIIYLLDGIWYDEHVVFLNSGTKDNPIIMTAYSGIPTLDGIDKTGCGINLEYQNHIKVSGLKVINYYHLLYLKGNNITISKCEFGHSGGNAVYVSEKSLFDDEFISYHNTIDECIIYDAGNNGIQVYGNSIREKSTGIPSEYITITNCKIFDMYGHNSIDLFGNLNHVLIKDNLIYDSSFNGIYSHSDIDTQRNLTIDNNTIFSVSNGMKLSNVYDSIISNNRVYDVGTCGIYTGAGSNNITFYKNNITSEEQPFDVGDSACTLIENIIEGNKEYRINIGKGSIRNAANTEYSIRAMWGASSTIEYTNNQVFIITSIISDTEYSISDIIYSTNRSYMSMETSQDGKSLTFIKTYPFYIQSTKHPLTVTSVTSTGLQVHSDFENNPAWINVKLPEFANKKVIMLINGDRYKTKKADSSGFVSFFYDDKWKSDPIFTWKLK